MFVLFFVVIARSGSGEAIQNYCIQSSGLLRCARNDGCWLISGDAPEDVSIDETEASDTPLPVISTPQKKA
jgi:hypothetical protein